MTTTVTFSDLDRGDVWARGHAAAPPAYAVVRNGQQHRAYRRRCLREHRTLVTIWYARKYATIQAWMPEPMFLMGGPPTTSPATDSAVGNLLAGALRSPGVSRSGTVDRMGRFHSISGIPRERAEDVAQRLYDLLEQDVARWRARWPAPDEPWSL